MRSRHILTERSGTSSSAKWQYQEEADAILEAALDTGEMSEIHGEALLYRDALAKTLERMRAIVDH